MKKTLLFLSLICFSYSITAQTNQQKAKSEYLSAESDFRSGRYSSCLSHLSEVETLLGSTNSKVLYLQIKVLYYSKQYQQIKDKDLFTQFFGMVDDETGDKYKEILGIYKKIEDWEIAEEKRKQQEREKQIAEEKRKQQEKRDYDFAFSSNRKEDKIDFLDKYPYSQYRSKIKDQLDDILWNNAQSSTKIEDYKEYIEVLPKGKRNVLARDKIAYNDILNYYNTKNYSVLIEHCDDYIKNFSSGEKIYEVKEYKQEAYYRLGEQYRLSNTSKAKEYYNKCLDVKSSGTYFTLSKERLEEFRIAALKKEKEGYYYQAMRYKNNAKQNANYTWLGYGGGIGMLGLGGYLFYLVADDFKGTDNDLLLSILSIGIATCSLYPFQFGGDNFRSWKKNKYNYKEEMRKYNNINVAFLPEFYPMNNAFGVSIIFQF